MMRLIRSVCFTLNLFNNVLFNNVCHAIHTHFFKKGGVFIGNGSARISNQPANVNSHSVILSDECTTPVVLYETN